MPKIVHVRAVPLEAPLLDPFVIASTTLDRLRNVAVGVELDDGSTGWGEVATLHPVTSETFADAWRAVHAAGPSLVGRGSHEWPLLWDELVAALPRHRATAAGVEMATADAHARSLGQPLAALFGPGRGPVRTDITLPITTVARAGELARRWRDRGFDRLKVKVGAAPEADLARLRAIHTAHPLAELCLDANEGWTADQALAVVRELATLGARVGLLEQPVPRDDLDGLRYVTTHAGVPVAADESCGSAADAERLAVEGRATVLNLKLAKTGLAGALKIVEVARRHGLGLMMGGMVETRIGMGTGAHLVSALGGFQWVDLDTPWLLTLDPVAAGTPLDGPVWDVASVRLGHGGAPTADRRYDVDRTEDS